MDEYLEILQKTKNYLPGYHYRPKNNAVIINNWGKSKEESIEENNNYYNMINNKNKSLSFDENSYNNYNNAFNSMNNNDKVRLLIKPIDSMYKFLTDEQNENEVNSFFLKQKKNKQNFYKNLLYSQYENTAKKNKNIFGTDDMLILQQKKKQLITENPYRQKNEYFFGDSNLKNNPILNPENNMRYNKYFKNFYKDISLNDINNEENINGNSNGNINDIEKNRSNYMAMNGSNIISDYKLNNEINKYKINYNNNGLSRNFSDIYNNYKTSNDNYNIKNYNIYDNIENKHTMLSNSKRSLSQIQI